MTERGYYEIFYPEVVTSNERVEVKFTYDGTYTNGYNKKGKKTWYYSDGSYDVEEGEFTTDSNRNLTGVAYDYDSSGKLIAKRVYEDGKVVSQIGS